MLRNANPRRRRHMYSGDEFSPISAPTDLPDLLMWFKYDTDITEFGGAVSQWDDQTANAIHIAQATATNQPTYDSDKSILFDGVDNYLQGSPPVNTPLPITIYVRLYQVTGTNLDRVCSGSSANSTSISQDSTQGDLEINSGSTTALNTAGALSTWQSVAAVFPSGGTNGALQVGTTSVSGDPGTNIMHNLFTVGARSGPGNWANVKIAEFFVYKAAHDLSTRNRVIAYLNAINPA